MNLIDTILERIAHNSEYTSTSDFIAGVYSGRREAYEDVLTMLGFYDANHEPRFTELPDWSYE